MAICAQPACSGPADGWLLVHRCDRVAELRSLDDSDGVGFGTPLCADHLTRVAAPVGWEMLDCRRGVVASPGSMSRPRAFLHPDRKADQMDNGGSVALVWQPRQAPMADEVDELRSVSSPLLRRAFLGAVDDDVGPQVGAEEPLVGQLNLAV